MSNEFEKYPVLTEYIREYASFGHFGNWSSFLAELNQALIKANPPTPASIEDEAEKLYPYDIEHYDEEDHERVKAIRDAMRLAHITCAGMYTGEIEKGREAIDILKALCALKRHKDTVGKDEYYEKAQPEVWKIANKFLEKHNP